MRNVVLVCYSWIPERELSSVVLRKSKHGDIQVYRISMKYRAFFHFEIDECKAFQVIAYLFCEFHLREYGSISVDQVWPNGFRGP